MKVDAECRFRLHQRRAGTRVAEDDDLSVGELEALRTGEGGMVHTCEDGEAALLDPGGEAGDRCGVVRSAAGDDHGL